MIQKVIVGISQTSDIDELLESGMRQLVWILNIRPYNGLVTEVEHIAEIVQSYHQAVSVYWVCRF